MRKGGILLSVHVDDQEWASKGRQILEQTGAEDISSIGETKGDFSNSDRPTDPTRACRARRGRQALRGSEEWWCRSKHHLRSRRCGRWHTGAGKSPVIRDRA